MQLEDPRIRYRQLQNERASTESIPLQTASQVSYYLLPFFLPLRPWPNLFTELVKRSTVSFL